MRLHDVHTFSTLQAKGMHFSFDTSVLDLLDLHGIVHFMSCLNMMRRAALPFRSIEHNDDADVLCFNDNSILPLLPSPHSLSTARDSIKLSYSVQYKLHGYPNTATTLLWSMVNRLLQKKLPLF